MMAGGGAYFRGGMAAAAGWTVGGYPPSSGHGGFPQYFVQNDGGDPSAGAVAVPDAASGVYGGIGGMDCPTSFAGYGGNPMAMAAPARPPPRVRATGSLFKAAWTTLEDQTLMEAVREHGNKHRKWAKISLRLPGRTGKQCRERWVNHVDPTIKNKQWTEAEDRELIAAHQSCGNRWSSIAKKLPGRSENSVKNHWNATRRSLKARRMLKKRNCEQPSPGQLSPLAEYIRSLYPAIEWPPAVLPAAPAPIEPDHQNQQVDPGTAIAAAPLAYAAPDISSMYSANVQHSWAPDMNTSAAGYPYYVPPCYPQVNYHVPYVPPPTPAQMISAQDLQAAAAYPNTDNMCPFAGQQNNLQGEPVMDRGSSTNNQMDNALGGGAKGWCYYGSADGAGPSHSGSGGGPDDVDVVQMASREFELQDQYMATLDQLTRFN